MGKSIIYGFLLTLAFLPALLLLLITVIGIPVAILLPFVYCLASLAGVACSGIYLGRRLRPGLSAGLAALLGLGSLVMMQWIAGALSHVPVLGLLGVVLHLIAGLGWLWAYFAGLGAIWLTRFGDPKRVARLREQPPPAASAPSTPPPSPVSPSSPPAAPTSWPAPASETIGGVREHPAAPEAPPAPTT